MNIKKLLQALLDSGISQNELSRLLDYSQASISLIVTGVRGAKRPDYNLVLRVLALIKKRKIKLTD